jgi:hypothetical protein
MAGQPIATVDLLATGFIDRQAKPLTFTSSDPPDRAIAGRD